jgi:competence protein ComFC
LSAEKRRREGLKAALRRLIPSWGKYAEILLYPSFCEICKTFLEKPGEKVLCQSCRDKIKPEAALSYCLCCGRFFEGAGEPHLCLDCLEKTPPFSKHRSCVRYDGIIKEIIHLYKYRGFEVLGQYLGDFAGQALSAEEDLWLGVDAIIPVPLHPAREKERGFNQAQVLALRLSKMKNLGVLEKRLVRVRNISPQTSLKAEARARNVHGAFQVRKPEEIEGKIVLLVDDVYTTGSTLCECSLVLIKAGAKEVRAVTVAQA